jgi:CHAD domain-containing protein
MTARPIARLDRPAGEVCRRLFGEQLDRAAAACERLGDRDDAEALHDFRVALRRLRGTLRAFPEPLAGGVGRRWSRRLGDLAGATGEGRDAEVALAWVEAQRPHLNWRQRRGLRWYVQRLAARKERAYAQVETAVPARFAALAERLRRRLVTPAAAPTAAVAEASGEAAEAAEAGTTVADAGEAPPETPPAPSAPAEPPPAPAAEEPFGALLARTARRRASRLVERLARVRAAGDEGPAHRARIAAKRLRYILEPAEAEATEARKAVRALRRLQDLLGELHDAHLLAHDLEAEGERAARDRTRELLAAALAGDDGAEAENRPPAPAAGRWDHVAGVVALARLNRERRDRLFATLVRGWLAGRGTADLAAAVGGLAARLEAEAMQAASAVALRDVAP